MDDASPISVDKLPMMTEQETDGLEVQQTLEGRLRWIEKNLFSFS